jgi:UPF0716 protein FxsA
MVFRLFLLFTIMPLLELAILIRVGQEIGAIYTISIVVLTGAAGAWLARAQGIGVLRRIRESIKAGEPPSAELVDGAFILLGGALLLTPGLITDAAGFFCLVPATRRAIQRWVVQKVMRRFEQSTVTVRGHAAWSESPPQEDVARKIN